MNNDERKKLQELKQNNENYVDNTNQLRKLKNSSLIKKDVSIILKHKHNNTLDIDSIKDECSFIYNYQSMLIN